MDFPFRVFSRVSRAKENAFRFWTHRKAERGFVCALALRIIVVKSNCGVHNRLKLKLSKIIQEKIIQVQTPKEKAWGQKCFGFHCKLLK
jgi:hypothetical protein